MIWLHEVIEDANNIYFVTEYYPSGSLGDMIRNETGSSKGIPTWQARFFFLDMLKAMHYCHNIVKVVHRDIKPENIMIGKNREAILIDFGLSAMYDLSDDAHD